MKKTLLIALTLIAATAFSQTNVFPSSGNVGIGTLSPNFLLDVNGPGNFTGYITTTGINCNGTLNADGNIYTSSNHLTFQHSNGEGVINFGNNGVGDLHFRVLPTGGYINTYDEVMTLTNDGNLGIGTMDPSGYRLAVNGDIRAKAIRVETGWADYVFDDDYELMPISELKEYISLNNHLPNLPKAQEVEEHGADLAKNDVMLLEKIEELTLYIIQLKAEIDELRADSNNNEIQE